MLERSPLPVADRRERIKELKVNGLTIAQIAKVLLAEGAFRVEKRRDAETDDAYAVRIGRNAQAAVYHDLRAVNKQLVAAGAERVVDSAREFYIAEQEQIYRIALAHVGSKLSEKDIAAGKKEMPHIARVAWARVAIDASKNKAAATGVNVAPKFKLELGLAKDDPAEAARAEVVALYEQAVAEEQAKQAALESQNHLLPPSSAVIDVAAGVPDK